MGRNRFASSRWSRNCLSCAVAGAIIGAGMAPGLEAATYTVTNTSGSGAGSLQLALTQAQTDANAVININSGLGTITLAGALPEIENNLTINGNGNAISGANAYRILFVNAPGDSVQVNGLSLVDGLAQGGTGGSGAGGGGGGAGLGGAIFLNAGNLTVSSVTFSGNQAVGGTGGYGSGDNGTNGGGGGGGGLSFGGGAGASDTIDAPITVGSGGGGGALTSAGGSGVLVSGAGGNGGGVNGGMGGPEGAGSVGGNGASPTAADGGGGGGGLSLANNTAGGNGGKGSDFGGGGGAGSATLGPSGTSGAGGFGGGGGGGAQAAGLAGNGASGGFGAGGGGGTEDSTGGTGGFGAGAGGAPPEMAPTGDGGGGLGAGGAIFTRLGSSLTVENSSFGADGVMGGSGASNGSAIGTAMFLGGNVNYDLTSGTAVLAETIGGGIDPNAEGAFTKSGGGTLYLTGAESYSGATDVSGGALIVNTALTGENCVIGSGATLEYSLTSRTTQPAITYTGTGTLAVDGTLVFGGGGLVNVAFSAGALVDVTAGKLVGSSSYQGDWTGNQASLNIDVGAAFDAVEAYSIATMQVDALTGAGTFEGGFSGNVGGLSTVQLGVAGGSGTFSGTIQDDASAHLAVVKTGGGTETFTGTNTYTGGTNVAAGKLVIGAAGSLPDAALAVSSTGTVQLAAGIGEVNISSLLMSGSGQLDVENNHLFINYGLGTDPIGSVRSWIEEGYAGGDWKGAGIMSTMAQSNSLSYGIGYADSADPGNPAGLASGQIEIMYTLLGDANLDGKVNGTDFNILAANFNTGGDSWDQGDFTYDGKVNGSDFNLLAANFNQGATQAADFAALESFAAANGLSLSANVPEPGVVGLLLPVSYCLLGKRRRALRERVESR